MFSNARCYSRCSVSSSCCCSNKPICLSLVLLTGMMGQLYISLYILYIIYTIIYLMYVLYILYRHISMELRSIDSSIPLSLYACIMEGDSLSVSLSLSLLDLHMWGIGIPRYVYTGKYIIYSIFYIYVHVCLIILLYILSLSGWLRVTVSIHLRDYCGSAVECFFLLLLLLLLSPSNALARGRQGERLPGRRRTQRAVSFGGDICLLPAELSPSFLVSCLSLSLSVSSHAGSEEGSWQLGVDGTNLNIYIIYLYIYKYIYIYTSVKECLSSPLLLPLSRAAAGLGTVSLSPSFWSLFSLGNFAACCSSSSSGKLDVAAAAAPGVYLCASGVVVAAATAAAAAGTAPATTVSFLLLWGRGAATPCIYRLHDLWLH